MFLATVDSILLPKRPIVEQDTLAAEDIFGPELGCLKGKTVRAKSTKVKISHATTPTTSACKR